MKRLSDAKAYTPQSTYLKKALCAAQAAIDKKALGPVLIDLVDSQSYTDYLLVASAVGPRAVRAIAEHVEKIMAEQGYTPLGVEGIREGRWALLDYGELVFHVFDQPLREFYDIEGMWFDAPKIPLAVPKEQQLPAPGIYAYGEKEAETEPAYIPSSSV